jgi:hypothetical protein
LLIHLAQPPLGIVRVRGDDLDVFDPLTAFGANGKAEPNHRARPPEHHNVPFAHRSCLVNGLAAAVAMIDQHPNANSP